MPSAMQYLKQRVHGEISNSMQRKLRVSKKVCADFVEFRFCSVPSGSATCTSCVGTLLCLFIACSMCRFDMDSGMALPAGPASHDDDPPGVDKVSGTNKPSQYAWYSDVSCCAPSSIYVIQSQRKKMLSIPETLQARACIELLSDAHHSFMKVNRVSEFSAASMH